MAVIREQHIHLSGPENEAAHKSFSLDSSCRTMSFRMESHRALREARGDPIFRSDRNTDAFRFPFPSARMSLKDIDIPRMPASTAAAHCNPDRSHMSVPVECGWEMVANYLLFFWNCSVSSHPVFVQNPAHSSRTAVQNSCAEMCRPGQSRPTVGLLLVLALLLLLGHSGHTGSGCTGRCRRHCHRRPSPSTLPLEDSTVGSSAARSGRNVLR